MRKKLKQLEGEAADGGQLRELLGDKGGGGGDKGKSKVEKQKEKEGKEVAMAIKKGAA